jgi:hypothetical protein
MTQLNATRKIVKRVEIIFDFSYLFTVLAAAAVLYSTAKAGSIRWQFALMSFILGAGDSFHLIPRIYSMTDRKNRDHTAALGIGKFITSITMTIFYVFLYEIGKNYYNFNSDIYNVIVYGSAVLRILLCIFPQNGWLDKYPSTKWAIIRNIPFLVLGMSVMLLYMAGACKYVGGLSYVWLAILISFACYVPVVLFAGTNPKVGMLMLPKSCAYAAIVLMGFSII